MTENNKIAFLISSTGWGGLEMNTLKLAKLLLQKGYEIVLYTQINSAILEKAKLIFSSIEIITIKRKYFDFVAAKEIGNSLIFNNIDKLLVVDNKDLDLAVWAKKRYHNDLKIVYQQHMQIGVNKKDFLHTFRYKNIDVWVSPLNFLKTEVAVRTKFPLSRVKVLPIGLDTKLFAERKYTKNDARMTLGISSNLPLVGIIGRISKKKGQLFLVESLQKMKSDGIEFQLLIFGSATVNDSEDQDYAEKLIQFVKVNKLEDFVHFSESQPDTAKFYNAIDVFVLSSHSETYGMVTIEAMLNELPILATNSGGTTEILSNGEFGTLYEYEDTDDFAHKLQLVLSEPEIYTDKAKLAKENALKLYDQEDEVEGFVKIFKAL